MATETKNVFLTQTKNAFLPYIAAFSDYMNQYMQQQGNLAEKMYAFNKKKQGEEFVGIYGSKIREAKDLSGLSKAMGEAITTGYSKGLEATLPTLKAIGDVQSSLIGEETLKKQATEYEDFILGQYGKQKFSWEGKAVTGEEIVGILRNKFTDPVARYTVLKNDLPQLSIIEQQGVVMKGNDAFLTTGGVDKFGNVFGNESYKILPTNKGVFYDTDKSGGYTSEDKSLPPSMAEKYSSLIEDRQRFNRQMTTYEKPKPLGMIDKEGHFLYAGNEGVFYNEVKDGKPTGNKVYVDNISQYSKITVPKFQAGQVIEQGQVTAYQGAVLGYKDTAVTRLVESGHLDRDEAENSVKTYNLDNNTQVAVKDIADDKLEKLYEEMSKEDKESPLTGQDLAAFQALQEWRSNKKNMEDYRMSYINQSKELKVFDASGKEIKDSTTVPTFDFNASNWKK